MFEFVDVQDLGRDGGHLVGREHPRANPDQQRQLARQRHRAQPPAWNRPHAPWRLQNEVHGLRLLDAGTLVLHAGASPGRSSGEARLHVRAQLLAVVGEAHEVEPRHRARVQARVADRQAV